MPSYISLLLLLLLAAASGLCQNCGPKYNNQICAANTCCTYASTSTLSPPLTNVHLTGSQYGWVSLANSQFVTIILVPISAVVSLFVTSSALRAMRLSPLWLLCYLQRLFFFFFWLFALLCNVTSDMHHEYLDSRRRLSRELFREEEKLRSVACVRYP